MRYENLIIFLLVSILMFELVFRVAQARHEDAIITLVEQILEEK